MLVFQGIFLCCLFRFSAGADWSYHNINEWGQHYPNCDLHKQSPINIVKGQAQFSRSLVDSLSFFKYSSSGIGNKFTVKNNGHSLQTDVSSVGASISLEGLGIYNLAQFQFHWGSDDTKGSEHMFNGHSFPAEVQLVHYRNDLGSVTNAKTHRKGLAVLGVMITRGNDNPAFDKFLDLWRNVEDTGEQVTIDAFEIKDLLPEYRKRFFRYEGSLTTPTCDQTVVWTLFDRPIQISEYQLNEFRKLKSSHGDEIANNFRPVQPLNGRTVQSNFRRRSSNDYAHGGYRRGGYRYGGGHGHGGGYRYGGGHGHGGGYRYGGGHGHGGGYRYGGGHGHGGGYRYGGYHYGK